jgi:hypothetical protein
MREKYLDQFKQKKPEEKRLLSPDNTALKNEMIQMGTRKTNFEELIPRQNKPNDSFSKDADVKTSDKR